MFRDLVPGVRDVTTALLLDGSSSLGAHSGRVFELEVACAALGGLDLPRKTLVGDLSSLDRTLLTVALATLRPAELVVLDDAQRGLDAEQLGRLMTGLVGLVEAGTCVVVSVLEEAVLPEASDRHRLERPPAETSPEPATAAVEESR